MGGESEHRKKQLIEKRLMSVSSRLLAQSPTNSRLRLGIQCLQAPPAEVPCKYRVCRGRASKAARSQAEPGTSATPPRNECKRDSTPPSHSVRHGEAVPNGMNGGYHGMSLVAISCASVDMKSTEGQRGGNQRKVLILHYESRSESSASSKVLSGLNDRNILRPL